MADDHNTAQTGSAGAGDRDQAGEDFDLGEDSEHIFDVIANNPDMIDLGITSLDDDEMFQLAQLDDDASEIPVESELRVTTDEEPTPAIYDRFTDTEKTELQQFASSMYGQAIQDRLVPAIDQCLGNTRSTADWINSIKATNVTVQQVEREFTDGKARGAINEGHFDRLSKTKTGPILPNGYRGAPTGKLSFWAPPHDGEKVLYPENYTMRLFTEKGLTGGVNDFYACDAIEYKTTMEQHKAPPIWKVDLFAFAKQFKFFRSDEQDSDTQLATYEIVRASLQNFEEVVRTSAGIPCLRFTQGAPVMELVRKSLEKFEKENADLELRKVVISLPIPDLSHLGVNMRTTIQRFDFITQGKGKTILGVFGYGPHASTAAYAGGSMAGSHSVGLGVRLDFLANLTCHILNVEVPKERVLSGLIRFWPSGKLSGKALTRALITMRKAEIDGGELINSANCDKPVLRALEALGIVHDDDENDGPTWLARMLSRAIKVGLAKRSKEAIKSYLQHLRKARAAYSPEKKAMIAAKNRASRAKLSDELSAKYQQQGRDNVVQQQAARMDRRDGQSQLFKRIDAQRMTLQCAEKGAVRFKLEYHTQVPHYRMRILQFYDVMPTGTTGIEGQVVAAQEWVEIVDAVDSKSSTRQAQSDAAKGHDSQKELFFCKNKGILYLRQVGRDKQNNLHFSAGRVSCTICQDGGDITAKTRRGFGARPRDACGPAQAYKKLVRSNDTDYEKKRGPHSALRLPEMDKWVDNNPKPWENAEVIKIDVVGPNFRQGQGKKRLVLHAPSPPALSSVGDQQITLETDESSPQQASRDFLNWILEKTEEDPTLDITVEGVLLGQLEAYSSRPESTIDADVSALADQVASELENPNTPIPSVDELADLLNQRLGLQ